MGQTVTLGGDRLGGGKKQKVYLHGYERSTHNKSHTWKSTMAAGTLVPFLKQLALPGDTMDIDLDANIMTQPTIGPLFGSYKVHMDVFAVPIRLYQAALHMNMLNIGMDMSKIYLPQIQVEAMNPNPISNIDNQQINPSCLLKYLGMSGMGYQTGSAGTVIRNFNAVPYLGYWDIYKNYYANKQETLGAMIHRSPAPITVSLNSAVWGLSNPGGGIPVGAAAAVYTLNTLTSSTYVLISFAGTLNADFNPATLLFYLDNATTTRYLTGDQVFQTWQINPTANTVVGSNPIPANTGGNGATWSLAIGKITLQQQQPWTPTKPSITTFPLARIDDARLAILQTPIAAPYLITRANLEPYGAPLQRYQVAVGPPQNNIYSAAYNQEGLALRTYASDLFNNWIATDTIDGPNGITAVTSVTVTGGKFTLDELNLQKKVYDMLNRIAVSGGTYDDWLNAVYDHDRKRGAESPIYLGGAIRNIVFQEVVSNSAAGTQPLGTLAGKGRMGGIKKGGRIIAKVDEPSYIMGIVSIVPNIEYSQGNDWDTNLRTMNDFHKPALDQIGFQNLTTDQMAWWDTLVTAPTNMTYASAGKQPAWINYMTEVSRVYGQFADINAQGFMVMGRKYDWQLSGGRPRIQDLTTYIDPSKWNNIFADVSITAENFWVQIAIGLTARRKMSAKTIPNL